MPNKKKISQSVYSKVLAFISFEQMPIFHPNVVIEVDRSVRKN